MINTEGTTCIECGVVFVRERGHLGNYCKECRDEFDFECTEGVIEKETGGNDAE